MGNVAESQHLGAAQRDIAPQECSSTCPLARVPFRAPSFQQHPFPTNRFAHVLLGIEVSKTSALAWSSPSMCFRSGSNCLRASDRVSSLQDSALHNFFVCHFGPFLGRDQKVITFWMQVLWASERSGSFDALDFTRYCEDVDASCKQLLDHSKALGGDRCSACQPSSFCF